MRSILRDYYPIKVVHYILDEQQNVAAWAITFGQPSEAYYKWEAAPLISYYYTRAKYRRMGLGTRLVKATTKYTNSLQRRNKYCIHDFRSEDFFYKCRLDNILTRRNSTAL